MPDSKSIPKLHIEAKYVSHSQACFEEDPHRLLTDEDSQGNGIAHLAAASGNTNVFEVWCIDLL